MSVLIGPGAYSDSGDKIPAAELANSESPYSIPTSIFGEGNTSNPYQGTPGNPKVTRITTDTNGQQTSTPIGEDFSFWLIGRLFFKYQISLLAN
jgi:hypothetical protein